jgi:transposase
LLYEKGIKLRERIDQGNHLFIMALGLVPPWAVDEVRFTAEEKRLDLHVNFPRGSQFPCPVCGQDCPVYDAQEKVWRHLDFFQQAAYLRAPVPRVQCPEHGVHWVSVPLGREGSGFTLLFEALVMAMVREMPVLTVSRLVRETDQRLWRVLDHYVAKARAAVDLPEVRAIGIDETCSRRGHDYISLFVDLEAKRLLFATPGKDAKTIKKFVENLQAHGGSAEAITEVSMELSPAFQKGAAEHLSNAQVTFDRFHLMKLVNEAVDAVRKGETLSQPNLKKSRWLWLKNPGKLSAKQSARLQELLKNQNIKTAQAYPLRLTFQEIFTIKNPHQGATLLKAWMENAKTSGLLPLVKVAYTLMNHWDGILRWFESQITNGILEGFNSLIQSARAKARGYRTHKNFINMAYQILGKLDLRLST